MKQNETKVVKVELGSEVILRTDSDCADVIVKINDKSYKALIRKSYEKKEPEVKIEGFDTTRIEDLGVTFDVSEILKAHTDAKMKRDAEIKTARDEESTKLYNSWMKRANTLGLTLNLTLKQFLAEAYYDRNRRLLMTKSFVHQGVKFQVTIRRGWDGWFEVETGYRKEQRRKTKKVEKFAKLIEEVVDEEKHSIERKQLTEKKKKESLKETKKIFGEDIIQDVYGSHMGGRWHTYPCYTLRTDDKIDSPTIKFVKCSFDGKYKIRSLEGLFTKEELKKILDIIRLVR